MESDCIFPFDIFILMADQRCKIYVMCSAPVYDYRAIYHKTQKNWKDTYWTVLDIDDNLHDRLLSVETDNVAYRGSFAGNLLQDQMFPCIIPSGKDCY